jgi:hypothetical protein
MATDPDRLEPDTPDADDADEDESVVVPIPDKEDDGSS